MRCGTKYLFCYILCFRLNTLLQDNFQFSAMIKYIVLYSIGHLFNIRNIINIQFFVRLLNIFVLHIIFRNFL